MLINTATSPMKNIGSCQLNSEPGENVSTITGRKAPITTEKQKAKMYTIRINSSPIEVLDERKAVSSPAKPASVIAISAMDERASLMFEIMLQQMGYVRTWPIAPV